MASEIENQSADKPVATVLEARAKQLQRAYQRQLRHRPTMHQRQLMRRASTLTARAEQAALDLSVTANDLVRLDRCAAHARRLMFAELARPKPKVPSLAELLERHA